MVLVYKKEHLIGAQNGGGDETDLTTEIVGSSGAGVEPLSVAAVLSDFVADGLFAVRIITSGGVV